MELSSLIDPYSPSIHEEAMVVLLFWTNRSQPLVAKELTVFQAFGLMLDFFPLNLLLVGVTNRDNHCKASLSMNATR